MTLFWSNHLAAQMFLMKDARLDYTYVALLRTYALGNFKQLVRQLTTNPGMLAYLNGNVNTAAAPNENYARELQELFTVGKGSGSHYTEEDVKQAARVLTGWQIKETPRGPAPVFKAANHDAGDKPFSAFYQNTVIKGKKGDAGSTETDALIDMLFAQREVARYVCRNLYRWLVYDTITPTVEQNVIEPLATVFISHDFEIQPVLKALLGSQHFFDTLNTGAQIKNPVYHLIGTCRQFGIVAFPKAIAQQYKVYSLLSYYLFLMGMDLGDPPNVAGWNATYQYPAFSQLWINATTLAIRNSTTDALLSARGLNNPEVKLFLDLAGFTSALPNPANVDELIEHSTRLLCPVPFKPAQVAYLKTILLSGQTSAHYWADAWLAYTQKPDNEMVKSVVLTRLSAYYTYILQRSEYQLC